MKTTTDSKLLPEEDPNMSAVSDYYKKFLPFISIGPSKVPFDHDVWGFPENEQHFKGLGVFQRISGSIGTILFTVVGDDIVSVPKFKLHKCQKPYQMESGFDEDFVIVPTVDSITSGKIPVAFRVQHSKRSPSHKMEWFSDPKGRDYPFSYPTLVPKHKTIIPMTEITFDYNF